MPPSTAAAVHSWHSSCMTSWQKGCMNTVSSNCFLATSINPSNFSCSIATLMIQHALPMKHYRTVGATTMDRNSLSSMAHHSLSQPIFIQRPFSRDVGAGKFSLRLSSVHFVEMLDPCKLTLGDELSTKSICMGLLATSLASRRMLA